MDRSSSTDRFPQDLTGLTQWAKAQNIPPNEVYTTLLESSPGLGEIFKVALEPHVTPDVIATACRTIQERQTLGSAGGAYQPPTGSVMDTGAKQTAGAKATA